MKKSSLPIIIILALALSIFTDVDNFIADKFRSINHLHLMSSADIQGLQEDAYEDGYADGHSDGEADADKSDDYSMYEQPDEYAYVTVYFTKSGECFHLDRNCSHIRNRDVSSAHVKDVIERLRPCKDCSYEIEVYYN